MSLTIEDLKPKNFKIVVKGVVLESKPLRLSHALTIAKIGNVFENTDKVTKEEIKQAENELDEVIGQLIPELDGAQVDISTALPLIEELMKNVEPADNKELREKGVKFNADPKAQEIG